MSAREKSAGRGGTSGMTRETSTSHRVNSVSERSWGDGRVVPRSRSLFLASVSRYRPSGRFRAAACSSSTSNATATGSSTVIVVDISSPKTECVNILAGRLLVVCDIMPFNFRFPILHHHAPRVGPLYLFAKGGVQRNLADPAALFPRARATESDGQGCASEDQSRVGEV